MDSSAASGESALRADGSGGTTAKVAATGDQRIDGILEGVKWSGASITYSDPTSASQYQFDHPESFTDFRHISATQLATARAALDTAIKGQPAAGYTYSVEGFTKLSISYAGANGSGTIRLADTSDPSTAYAYFPSAESYGGDVFYGASGRKPVAGNYDYHTMIHEIGHALGLKHGQDTGVYGALPSANDSMEFSVMTYRSYVGGPTDGYSNETYGYAQTYMMDDIAALQHMYGADFTLNGGDTTYTWNPATGSSYVDGVLALDPGANRIFQTLWDGNGTDTYDLSNYATNLKVDLTPGGHSTFSSVQLADLGDGHTARGNLFNALQYHGDSRSLIENAIGGSGNDSLNGNAAANVLTGNAGADTLLGGDGTDSLLGGSGNDSLKGGTGNDSLQGGAGEDSLVGGNHNDRLLGGDGNDRLFGNIGADTLQGEAGNDTLAGSDGRDVLVGGAGKDVFDFDFVADSPAGKTCDVLQAGGGAAAFDGAGAAAGDRIDLSGIDADTTTAGNQAFVFGGTGKGHVWCVNAGTTTEVFANIDNDATPEFQLDILDGGVLATAYKAADFIL